MKTHINHVARSRLVALFSSLQREREYFLGFPAALDFDYQELGETLNVFLNNVGDPYVPNLHGIHTKEIEQEVVAFFASLFRAPANDYWGYVTNGSTEAILHALYVARQKYPGAAVYYSAAAHYGVAKNIHILAMQGVEVRAQPSGEMDYADLARRLAGRRSNSAIVLATIGTTMTEARDDVAKIANVLKKSGASGSFIHADAALAGTYAALLQPHMPFDFEDGADSISVSGHKFIGSPIPCGVVVMKKHDQQLLVGPANYTGSTDTTISGSRNGHTPLLLWYALQRWGLIGMRQRAESSQKVAQYALERLQSIGWPAWRNPQALTVMIKSPPAIITRKWQLATADGWSHIICMPGVTKTKVDAFIHELSQTKPRPKTPTSTGLVLKK